MNAVVDYLVAVTLMSAFVAVLAYAAERIPGEWLDAVIERLL